jgi:hypothetical protein
MELLNLSHAVRHRRYVQRPEGPGPLHFEIRSKNEVSSGSFLKHLSYAKILKLEAILTVCRQQYQAIINKIGLDYAINYDSLIIRKVGYLYA